MKGVILTAGNAKRLRPITDCYGKVLVPIYDKPMIFYGLSVMIKLGISEVAIVCNKSDFNVYKKLLVKRYKKFKIKLFIQEKALGTAHALSYVKDFVGKDDFTLLFGDNIFVMNDLKKYLCEAKFKNNGITLFAKNVSDPERFGVIQSDDNNNVISVEEKPKSPKSNLASTGLYICENNVINELSNLKMSERGEYEFTDIINKYVKNAKARVCILPENCNWLDTGTFDSLLECSNVVKNYEDSYGLYSCLELDLFKENIISKDEFLNEIDHYSNNYKEKILSCL